MLFGRTCSCCSSGRSFERDDHLLFGVERNWIDPEAAIGVACRSSRADIETAGMERAHESPLPQNAVGERTALVRACCLCGENGAVAASEHGDRHTLDFKKFPLSHWDAVHASQIRSDR